MSGAAVSLGPRHADRELVLLPPVRGRPADAIAAGFETALAAVPSPPRVTLIDLPEDTLASRAGVVTLWPEHLAPSIAAGRRVWLGGISLGAWLSVLTTRTADPAVSSRLAGLALIAPWLGTREVHRELDAAGGPRAWARTTPPRATAPATGSVDEEREGWRFLVSTPVPIWLGHGVDDRFADAQSMLAAALPSNCVHREAGGHDWSCWGRIWEHLLRWLPC